MRKRHHEPNRLAIGRSDVFNPTNFNTSTVSWLAANQNASGTPVQGGTLRIEGSTDLSAAADPQGEYETIAFGLERAYTRQLDVLSGLQ